MSERTELNSLAALAPVEELLGEVEQFVLCLIASSSSQCLNREILSVRTIAIGLVAVHSYLVAIIELRDASQCEQESESLEIAIMIVGKFLCLVEAVGIMVVEEGEQVERIGINAILSNLLIDLGKASVPVVGLLIDCLVEE